MMREKYESQLAMLNNMLIEMGGLIESAISIAIKALHSDDVELVEKVRLYELEVDQKEKDIEAHCLKLILQQQPVAKDLRLISAALKMITDMERIGDQASDISEITLMLTETPNAKILDPIEQMAQATVKMVTNSIDAFVKSDLILAKEVMKCDDIVDDLFKKVRSELIALIKEDAQNGEQAIDMLMIAKYFERIGDHAENIAEWVEFSITGKHGKE